MRKSILEGRVKDLEDRIIKLETTLAVLIGGKYQTQEREEYEQRQASPSADNSNQNAKR
jgi:hypothetical protein